MDLVGSSDSLAAPTETEASVVLPEEKVDKKEDKRDNGLLTDPLNTYLQVQQLALTIAVHPSVNPIQINAIARPGGNHPKTGTTPTIQRKNTAKQCACCKMFGHCIDVKDKTDKKDMQICRIGAQIYHVTKYAKQHKDEMEVNAAMYEGMNTPKHVKFVKIKNNPPSSELEDACEKQFIAELHNDNNEMDQDSN